MTSSPQGGASGKKDSTTMSSIKGVLVMILLLVLAGAGGYFFGTMQQIAPIKKVPPGTTGAVEMASSSTGSTVAAPAGNSKLKKSYWIHSRGNDQVGYAISISVNGTPVGMIQGPNRNIEITKMLHTGNNQVLFQARSLPMSQRDASTTFHELTLAIMAGDKFGEGYANAEALLQYTRKVTDSKDYNDDMPLMIVEE